VRGWRRRFRRSISALIDDCLLLLAIVGLDMSFDTTEVIGALVLNCSVAPVACIVRASLGLVVAA
jgi:hypothetical protein